MKEVAICNRYGSLVVEEIAMSNLSAHVTGELDRAAHAGSPEAAFAHLERAHILGQYSTRDHVRVHAAMLRWGLAQRDLREVAGQVIRIIAAATKTALGWIPVGNTGGANVSPIKPMPLPDDLAEIISRHRG
ncbi:DUF3703 domain-containing protein [Erythrobacter sp.]|jgi:hypothetical protein|uniref:DUF3703 domain-containing protein n=1 Tax=Erythrobacter sp. TaxID=1042 RepID=UPI002EAA2B3C|nr:DUF3703 domain-containing protein [Erythrobacter sp.]